MHRNRPITRLAGDLAKLDPKPEVEPVSPPEDGNAEPGDDPKAALGGSIARQVRVGILAEYARCAFPIEYQPDPCRLNRPAHGGDVVGDRRPLPPLKILHRAE
jgi:hypothetical protein